MAVTEYLKQPSFPYGVVILGNETQGLGILRSLARRGVPTVVIDQDRWGVALASKYCRKFFHSPPYREYHAFVEFLIETGKKHGLENWTLFPTDDEQVRALSENKSIISCFYRNWIPDWPSIEIVYDKSKFYSFAQQLGIDIPQTKVFFSWEEVAAVEISFPVIIKPAVKEVFFKTYRKKAIEVHSRKELIRQLRQITRIIELDKLLVQEIIPGPSSLQFSYAAFFKNGVPEIDLTARRTRQHPMDYGRASTFVEVVDFPQLRDISVKLLGALNYYGVCEVEFKKDHRTDKLKLLEINARFWGWHTLTESTGINWPFNLFCDIYELDYSRYHASAVIKKKQWLKMTTDLPIALHECVKNRLSVLKLIGQYLSFSTIHVTFNWKDPLPFIIEWLLIPYLWIKRGY
ncbi:MAG: hypothetical protein JXB48_22330 [Candidatus Latescibacteria bacterium]|nr:hypothetical protein [Candidatus Latescibacterota bacterium]